METIVHRNKRHIPHILLALTLGLILLLGLGLLLTRGTARAEDILWQDFAPETWVTHLPVTVHVRAESTRALTRTHAAYRWTTDGGTTWSEWKEDLEARRPISTRLLLTATIPSLPDGETRNGVQFRVYTQDGEEAISPLFPLHVDTQGPTVEITDPRDGDVVDRVEIRGRANDATSGLDSVALRILDAAGAYWDGHTWITAPTWIAVGDTPTWTYTPPTPWGEGPYTLTVRARDKAGLETLTPPLHFRVDHSPPEAPRAVHIHPSDWTNQNLFTITWENPPDPAGIRAVHYTIGHPPLGPNDGTRVEEEGISRLEGITVTEGATPIFLWLEDGLGHSDPTRAARVVARYDATPPGAPYALQSSPKGWQHTNDFTLTWRNPPDLSGIVAAYYRLEREPQHPTDGIRVEGEGIRRIAHIRVPREGVFDVYLWLVDAAGNVDHTRRNVLTRAFRLDTTPPVLTAVITGTLGHEDWYTTPVEIQMRAVDGLSGVDHVMYQIDGGAWHTGTHVTLERDGEYIFVAQAVDRAGNTSVPLTHTLRVDTTPPRLTYTLPILPDGQAWYKEPVRITLQVGDDTSGLAHVRYRLDGGAWQDLGEKRELLIRRDGNHRLWLTAEDRAGNTRTVGPIPVPVDTGPPVTAYVVTGREGDGHWYISPITVTLTPTDTASGVVATYYRIDDGPWQEGTQFSIAEDGRHTIEFYSVDAAGWREQGFPTPIWVDTTPPPAPPYIWAEPNGWTRVNEFTLRWATPSDLSQVVGAYYKLDAPPTSPEDGTYVEGGHFIPHLRVPNEGAHTVYVWLRDGAGNASIENLAVLEQGLKYDATPPTTQHHLQGRPGMAGWWRSPVTLTLTVSDVLSGPEATYVSVDGHEWTRRYRLTLRAEGKHSVRYYSVDQAGNRETAHDVTVRIDVTPPQTPDDLEIVTRGWQHENRFIARWTPPLDLSGIGGIRYTVGTPPNGPEDGTFSPGRTSAVLRAPGEGIFDVYVWLVDGAGNGDPTTAKHFPRALWYDNTPPDMEVILTGTQGENDWYVTPVTLTVTASDAASDMAHIWVQIDDNPPLDYEGPLRLDRDGRYRIRVWAEDNAGNKTPVWERRIAIDLTPPTTRMHPLPAYMSDFTPLQGNLVKFTVRWEGDDGHGSGIAGYDVQVKEGLRGHWTLWLSHTEETSGTFIGEIGHTYFFRIRARDRAGHEAAYTTAPRGDTYTHVEPVRNGDFELGNILYWSAARVPQPEVGGRGLKLTVKSAPGYTGNSTLAAWLGDPDYGGAENPGLVPIGGAVISQTVTVPSRSQMPHPTLEFWYHMITWDVVYSPSHHRWQDTFEFRLYDTSGRELTPPWREGYRARNHPPVKGVDFAVKHDLGWRRARFDLSPYAGQTVILEFSTWNRWDNQYNTYTVLDDVRIVDTTLTPHHYLPLLWGKGMRPEEPETPQNPPVLPQRLEEEAWER